MKSQNILIASHSLGEAITQCVVKNQAYFKSTKIVTLHELIYEIDIFDELGDAHKKIRWYKNNELYISNSNHLLLNRVLHIPPSLFERFTDNDKEYAQREFESYIGFSFNNFLGVGNKTANGICTKILSLPQQWNIIQNLFSLIVPHYYWGPKENLNLKNQLVHSTIYNFMNWAPHERMSSKNHLFCFEKPQGIPIFIFSIGNKQLLISNIDISDSVKNTIKFLSKKINFHLKYFISEILFFIHHDTLTFGCINPNIVRAPNNKYFEDFVCKNLTNEFYACLS